MIDSDDKYDESVMEVHKEAQDEGERIDPEQLEWVSDVANELDITPPSITNLSRGNDGVCQAIEFCSRFYVRCSIYSFALTPHLAVD